MLFRWIKDFGIHKDAGVPNAFAVGSLILKVNDQKTLGHPNLNGCKAYSGSSVHGFKHVIDKLFQVSVKAFHRCGDGFQPRIGHFKNW